MGYGASINHLPVHRFIPLLGELMVSSNSALRGAATDMLTEIVSKRMEPTSKINLVQELKVVESCERLSSNLVAAAGANKAAAGVTASGKAGSSSNSSVSGQDDELLAKYAKLLATLAGEVMDALKRVENGECWVR